MSENDLVSPIPAKTFRDLPATQENYDLLCSVMEKLYAQNCRYERIKISLREENAHLRKIIENVSHENFLRTTYQET